MAWHGHGIGGETGHLFVRVMPASCLRADRMLMRSSGDGNELEIGRDVVGKMKTILLV